MQPDRETEKTNAARRSIEFIRDGMTVGLGSGSTARLMIEILADKLHQGLRIQAVPTSKATAQLARSRGIPLTSLDQTPALDLTIDGADEFDPHLNLIKGLGGALLHEKIVAAASAQMIVIADSSKQVDQLGSIPVPVEVHAFGWKSLVSKLALLAGAAPMLRFAGSGAPFVTDENNFILDCPFQRIADPAALAHELDAIPGIVEHGLFIGMADMVIVGGPDGAVCIKK